MFKQELVEDLGQLAPPDPPWTNEVETAREMKISHVEPDQAAHFDIVLHQIAREAANAVAGDHSHS